jgi:UDP-N-acetylglucosamine 2-epimerase (non-hydrolysing)
VSAHVLSVVGARPQFVKAFAVAGPLRERHEATLVHTGQHYDDELSGVFFRELDIPQPDYHLAAGSGSHAAQTARTMERLDTVVAAEEPDAVLVYGDTNATLAAALVAAKRDPALVHVEAGLRSDDWSMPEEVNRVLTDHCSDLLCVPSAAATDRLAAEGIDDGVVETGDVMYDAALRVSARAPAYSSALDDLGLAAGEFVLATVHRAANTDDPDRLAGILEGLAAVPDRVVVPLHPRTEGALREYGRYEAATEALDLVDPLGYVDFLRLVGAARVVATDSGGVQKEAFYLDTPCVTLRDETEWVETVDCGWNVLVGADRAAIERELVREFDPPTKPSLYGDGTAATEITAVIDDA